MFKISEEADDIFNDFCKKVKKICGNRFIDIGLENVAVAAASVVAGPSRCSNNGSQKRRCLSNACENHLFDGLKSERGRQRETSLY